MIQLNKNLLHVRDTETKEFRPLNVLGTYGDVLDEFLDYNSLRGVQNKTITGKFQEIERDIDSKVDSSVLDNYVTSSDLDKYQLEKPWATFLLDESQTAGSTYFFKPKSYIKNQTPIPLRENSLAKKIRLNGSTYFVMPQEGEITITINAFMASTTNPNDIGLFIYYYEDQSWSNAVGGFGTLGKTDNPNFISITSCPIPVPANQIIQVIAGHAGGDISVCSFTGQDSLLGLAGIPYSYGYGNTITFRYI